MLKSSCYGHHILCNAGAHPTQRGKPVPARIAYTAILLLRRCNLHLFGENHQYFSLASSGTHAGQTHTLTFLRPLPPAMAAAIFCSFDFCCVFGGCLVSSNVATAQKAIQQLRQQQYTAVTDNRERDVQRNEKQTVRQRGQHRDNPRQLVHTRKASSKMQSGCEHAEFAGW